MKRIHMLSTALIALAVAGPAVVHAQDPRRRGTDPRDERGRQTQQAQPSQAQQDPRLQHAQQARPQPQEDPRRVQDEQNRANEARQRAFEQQAQIARRQVDEQAEARRAAEYRAQQEYTARIQREQLQQQLRIENERYRYNIGGRYRETSQYGADMLRQAVNNGYLEGIRAGQVDRQNRWSPNYESALAHRDAEYGFTGNYVDRSDYSYYFRQGFQRGYEDGYYSRSQYGNYSNGSGSMLGNVLMSILGLELVR